MARPFARSFDTRSLFVQLSNVRIRAVSLSSRKTAVRALRTILVALSIPICSAAQDYDSRDFVEKAAKRGDIHAMHRLAEMARDGEDGPQDFKLAAAIFLRLAQAHDSEAAFQLGYFYANGWGVDRDVAEAQKWFNIGAVTGMQQVQLADLYAEGRILPRDDEKAIALYKRAGSVGAAEIGLAKLYAEGRGGPQNLEKAAEQLHNASIGNHPEAQILYGDMLMAGRGVPQSTTEALDWYQRAAQRRLGEVAHDIAVDYSGARGSDREPELEFRWRRYAAALNMDLAETQLAHAYLAGKDVPRNLVDGFAWLALARTQWSAAGNEFDQLAKGAPPEFLDRVQARVSELQSLKQSTGGYFDDPLYASPIPPIETLQRLAQQEVPLAQVRLAYAYQKGQGVAPDLNSAIALYKRVEHDGPMELHLQIGISYFEGQGLSQNYSIARNWLGRAAEEGSVHAARLLGELERDGRGGDTSLVNAAMWFLLAAADQKAMQDLDAISAKLTTEQDQRARQLADIWRMKHPVGLH